MNRACVENALISLASRAPRWHRSAAARARRGARYLNKTCPGWAARVDIGRLNLASPHLCILGQVFAAPARAGGHATGFMWAAQNLPGLKPDRMGFSTVESDYEIQAADFAALDLAWAQIVRHELAGTGR